MKERFERFGVTQEEKRKIYCNLKKKNLCQNLSIFLYQSIIV